MPDFGGSFSVDIDAPAARCYEVAADVESAPEWHGSMKAAAALEHDADGRPTLVDAQFDAIVTSAKLKLRFAYEPPTRMSWERESGDLRSLRGAWTFEELAPNRTRATYTLDFDPGRVLSMLARGPVVGKVTDHLGRRPPEGLKRAVEGR
jgi:ribosome-associated toxin RatA of RatAB toxin-antitoxin module